MRNTWKWNIYDLFSILTNQMGCAHVEKEESYVFTHIYIYIYTHTKYMFYLRPTLHVEGHNAILV